MENYTFETIIKGDAKLSDSEYIRGRVSGIMDALCSNLYSKEGYAYALRDNGDYVMWIDTTADKYTAFIKVIEGMYPGLCKFDNRVCIN